MFSRRETLLDILSKEKDSAGRKYRDLYVGSESLLDFLVYELLTLFLTPIPGGLGLFLRKLFYKWLFASIGHNAIIGPFVTLRCPRRITLGNNNFIDSHSILDAKGQDSRIQLGDNLLLGSSSIISCSSATVKIGTDVSIGPHCFIRAGIGPIKIGSYITVGAHTTIVSGNPSYERSDIPMKYQLGSVEGIVIGDDVWIGVGVRIIDGVTIGNGSVVGAGAVVIEDVPDQAIVAGVPAKIIGYRNQRESTSEH